MHPAMLQAIWDHGLLGVTDRSRFQRRPLFVHTPASVSFVADYIFLSTPKVPNVSQKLFYLMAVQLFAKYVRLLDVSAPKLKEIYI